MCRHSQLVALAISVAIVSSHAECEEHHECNSSPTDELDLLQTSVKFTQHRHTSGTLQKKDGCDPNGLDDMLQSAQASITERNQSLIDRYRSEGKITESGFPILDYAHIPKTGGEAFQVAAAPLGPYGMALGNRALKKALPPDAFSPENCFFTQSPAIYQDYKLAKAVYGDSEIFCAVRDPYAKAWSGACHMQQYNKTLKHLTPLPSVDEIMRMYLKLYLAGDRKVGTCFWAPQVDFLKGPFGCKHILDFDDLENEYNRIVKQFGFDDLKLPPPSATHSCSTHCGEPDISAETLELLEQVYAEDIAFWKEFKRNRSSIH